MTRTVLLTVVCLTVSTSWAYAAGYEIREQSADAMASAYAGAAATGTDASYLAYNPAAASSKGGDASLSAVDILPSSSANYSTALTSAGTPISGSSKLSGFIRNAIIPDLAIRQRLSDHWSAGLSVSVPWGLSTDYPASGVSRYYGLDTKLVAVNVSPVVAYDLTPALTIAGGFQAQYAKGTLTSAVDLGTLGALSGLSGSQPGAMDGMANVNAHNWAYGFVIGTRATLDDGWTLGLSYRSAVHHTLKGPWTFSPDSYGLAAGITAATGLLSNTSAHAKLTTPDTVEFGVRKLWNDHLTALLEVDWTGWSAFHNLDVSAANPVQPDDITNAKWHDAWMAALGLEYIINDDWQIRAGTAYDGSPVPESTLGPRIPDADRYWLSAGVTYHATSALDLKLTLSHLFDDDRDIAQSPGLPGNALRGALIGSTQSSVDVVGSQIDYRWQ